MATIKEVEHSELGNRDLDHVNFRIEEYDNKCINPIRNFQRKGKDESNKIKNNDSIISGISNSVEALIGNLEGKLNDLGKVSDEKIIQIQCIVAAIQSDQNRNHEIILNLGKEKNQTLTEIKQLIKDIKSDSKVQETKIQILEKQILDIEKKLESISSDIEFLKFQSTKTSQKQHFHKKVSSIPQLNSRDYTPKSNPKLMNADEPIGDYNCQMNSLIASKIENELKIIRQLIEININHSKDISINIQISQQETKSINNGNEFLNVVESNTLNIEKIIESSFISFKKSIEETIKQSFSGTTQEKSYNEGSLNNSPGTIFDIKATERNARNNSAEYINYNDDDKKRFEESYKAFEQILEEFNSLQ